MFADITGFTSKVEIHPVEEVVEVLNRYFETVVPLIFAHGGMLDKFLGDGVMAVFGIPDADESDPLRAIQCAVDIQRMMQGLNVSLNEQGLFPIEVGIGIATGQVIAGNIGSAEQMNFTVIGDPVNLAQRLEGISASGEIIVARNTAERAQLQGRLPVRFEPMGSVPIKGITRDVQPLRVLFSS